MAVEDQRNNNLGGVTGKGFLPGQSGNPGGRPKGRTLTSRLREALALESAPGSGRTRADALVSVLLKIALEGDRQAIKDIFDRHDGRVPDADEVTQSGDADLSDEERIELEDKVDRLASGADPPGLPVVPDPG